LSAKKSKRIVKKLGDFHSAILPKGIGLCKCQPVVFFRSNVLYEMWVIEAKTISILFQKTLLDYWLSSASTDGTS